MNQRKNLTEKIDKSFHYITVTFGIIATFSIVLGGLLLMLNRQAEIPPRWGFRGFQFFNAIPWTMLGMLVTWKKPRNPVGWYLLLSGLVGAGVAILEEYAIHVLVVDPGVLAGGEMAAVIANWLWIPSMSLLLIHALLVFPDGTYLTKRWRLVHWMANIFIVLAAIAFTIVPGPVENYSFVQNPVGIDKLSNPQFNVTIITSLTGILLFLMVLSAYSLILRFKRSSGVLRQQLKWIAYIGLLAPFSSLGGFIEGFLGDFLVITFIGATVSAFGFSILRYRLYDIDLVIRRTIQYALLTGLLALVYFASVIMLQSLVENLTGEQSPLVIVFSTLAIAALFNPLRTRVQDFIDRRFYRKKYDAERALSDFTATTRDEVDITKMTNALINVVYQTMQPDQLILWLKEEK